MPLKMSLYLTAIAFWNFPPSSALIAPLFTTPSSTTDTITPLSTQYVLSVNLRVILIKQKRIDMIMEIKPKSEQNTTF